VPQLAEVDRDPERDEACQCEAAHQSGRIPKQSHTDDTTDALRKYGPKIRLHRQ
jgi:hypothetical protein